MATTRNRNRILADLNNPHGTLVDLLATGTDTQPRFARGYDCQFEIGLSELAALQLAIGHIASITLEVKRPRAGLYAPTDADPVLMSQTLAAVDLNGDLTVETWATNAEADSHALFAFSAGETANCPAAELWLVIHALTTDVPGRRILYAAALIDCEETGAPSDTEPEAPLASYYTAAEADARYQQLADNVALLAKTTFNVHPRTIDDDLTVGADEGMMLVGDITINATLTLETGAQAAIIGATS